MASYGYARVSTTDQDLAGQREALARAGCSVIREETASGASMAERGELRTVLAFLGAGDELVVTRVDRLARSVSDLQDVVRELRAKGASLRCTEQPVDTGTPAGKAFLDMLGVFAEFETALRRERQMEGITRAKAAGKYKGRHPAELWPNLGDGGLRGRRIVAGVQACQDLQRERYAVTETTSILPFRQSDEVDDPLTALAREGARRILAEAGAAEADAFVAAFAEARLEDGRRRVVRHGHGPERAIQTGVGPVPVRRPKSLPRT